MRQILLIMIGLSSLIYAEFSRENGVVTDSVTLLQWQDDYSDNNNDVKETYWEDAINYCHNLDLNGVGWRLPNINEINSLIDDTKSDEVIYAIFENVENNFYWSSTSYRYDTSKARGFHFNFGYQYNYYPKGSSHLVRCVSAGQ